VSRRRRWVIGSLAVIVVLTVGASTARQAFGPARAPGPPLAGSGLVGVRDGGSSPGVRRESTTAAAHLGPRPIGSWRELGDPEVTLSLARDGIASIDMSLDGSTVWRQQGRYAIAHDLVTATCFLVVPDGAGVEGCAERQTFVLAHGTLKCRADGVEFTRAA
jgi:hypothetical protein